MIFTTKFNDGFKKGYVQGYCFEVQNCIKPIIPIPPLPKLLESSNSFQDGYNRGFINGRNAKD
jgi:hypothetical protein